MPLRYLDAARSQSLLTVMCWLLRVVRVVCDGCDWTAGRKSGAFSSVGLAVQSLACCPVTFHADCRHGLLTVMCRLLRVVRVVCDGFVFVVFCGVRSFCQCEDA